MKQPGIAEKLQRLYQQPRPEPSRDPDADLYSGFLQDEDRSRCEHMHEQLKKGIFQSLDFNDARLTTLAERMKARSFPSLMDQDDLPGWREFVVSKLDSDGDWLSLQKFEERSLELIQMPERDEAEQRVLTQLLEHAADLRNRYHL